MGFGVLLGLSPVSEGDRLVSGGRGAAIGGLYESVPWPCADMTVGMGAARGGTPGPCIGATSGVRSVREGTSGPCISVAGGTGAARGGTPGPCIGVAGGTGAMWAVIVGTTSCMSKCVEDSNTFVLQEGER